MMFEKKNLIKLIAMVVLILVLPSLFFAYIGQDPTKKTERSTGEIAIVNEDLGAEFQGEQMYFGQAVTSSLGENSEYSYVVVGRNAAESGLERNQYDGILYLSSDFSRNVLTFKEDEPQRAALSYRIQPNLDARNIERVQRSLQNARNRINRQVTSIYWDVVAQEVDDIRQKFDTIVEREIAFQEAMYSFYAPSSRTIAEEVEQQKELLEQLLASSSDAEATSEEMIVGIETSEQQLASFLDNVQSYREYQEQQKELLLTTSLENQQLLEEGLTTYESTMTGGFDTIVRIRENPRPAFMNDGADFSNSLSVVEGSIDTNRSLLTNLRGTAGQETVDGLASQIQSTQRDMLSEFRNVRASQSFNQLEASMLPLRNELANQVPEEEGEGEDNSSPKVEVELPTGELVTADALNELKAQLAQLKVIIEAVPREENVVAQVEDEEEQTEELEEAEETEETEEESEGNGNSRLEELRAAANALDEEVERVEAMLNEQASIQEDWERVFQVLIEELENNPGTAPPIGTPVDEVIRAKIKETESQILAADYLTGSRKQRLAPYFESTIGSRDMEQLLTYYSYLSAYRERANQSSQLEEEVISDILQNHENRTAVEETFEEIEGGVSDLQTGLDQSRENLDLLERDFESFVESVYTFIDEYDEIVQQEQELIAAELQEIEGNATQITNALRDGTTTPEVENAPIEGMDGEIIISSQQEARTNIQQVSNLVSSLSDRSGYVNEYTDELYEKVGSVQSRANELNNNWATNVEATQLVQDDIYSILRNAVVDGQPNPYVYDHLSNPVQISGEAPEESVNHTPPVVMLIIILISALVMGIFVYYFSYVPTMLNITMFVLLNLAVGLIISIYGLNIYPMNDMQSFQWTVVTILFLIAASGLVQLGLTIGLITGGLVIVGLMLFFVTPLMDLVMPNFSMSHPISQVYMSIQFGDKSLFIPAVLITSIISLIVVAIPYLIRIRRSKKEEVDLDESYEG
ncbi:type VII secretion protein EsaA [Alkalihalophilus lindianensis]|uniref:Type VII secretion protein EsaA n=1 Tax=Alkalihalophilus lindianensis TaxID=1630542 RepID=A0ABU3XFD3_9BACI|nr:type VII secretion protein EsaA [Alkalihalophilus lindianensis]MDV2686600.1 type VII secretion protein EsaA [Alkalihalophilus lindianensis]